MSQIGTKVNQPLFIQAPYAIDGRLIVDRVDGSTESLVSLIVPNNYPNMYVWVRDEKLFYYLIDSPTEGGATVSDWASFSGGSQNNQGLGDGKTGSTPFYYNNDWVVQSTHLYNDGNQVSINGGGLGANGTPSSYQPNAAKFTVWSDSCIAVFEAATNSFVTNIEARNWKSGTDAAAAVGIYATMGPGLDGLTLGALSKDFSDFPGYGRSCDTFIYSGACARSLNIIQQGNVGTFQDADIKLFANSDANSISTLRVFNRGITAGAILPNSYELRFGDKDTCNDQKNGSTDATSGRYVILKSPQTLEERWTLTWPKQGPASYSTTFNTALMWNGSEYIWGTAGQLGVAGGGGGGSITLEPNAGLTNSGETYATIYNTLITDNIKVADGLPQETPTAPSPPPGGLHPLTWLRGLTAGYLKEKNIVEVLNMILFPTVPYTYIAPTLSLTQPNSPRKVSISQDSVDLDLTYTTNDGGTPSQYTWRKNSTLINQQTTNSTSVSYTDSSVTINTPVTYTFTGTASYLEGPVKNDSNGSPQPGNIQAGIVSDSKTVRYIFPYYHGKVSNTKTLSNINNSDITGGTEQVKIATDTLPITFNTTNVEKGFLAIPQNITGQNDNPTYVKWVDQNLFTEAIPSTLFNVGQIYPVTVNGIQHTYSVYLFNQGSQTSGAITFYTTP